MKHDTTTFPSWYKETHPKEFDLVHIQKDPEEVKKYKSLQHEWWIFWLEIMIDNERMKLLETKEN